MLVESPVFPDAVYKIVDDTLLPVLVEVELVLVVEVAVEVDVLVLPPELLASYTTYPPQVEPISTAEPLTVWRPDCPVHSAR